MQRSTTVHGYFRKTWAFLSNLRTHLNKYCTVKSFHEANLIEEETARICNNLGHFMHEE